MLITRGGQLAVRLEAISLTQSTSNVGRLRAYAGLGRA